METVTTIQTSRENARAEDISGATEAALEAVNPASLYIVELQNH